MLVVSMARLKRGLVSPCAVDLSRCATGHSNIFAEEIKYRFDGSAWQSDASVNKGSNRLKCLRVLDKGFRRK